MQMVIWILIPLIVGSISGVVSYWILHKKNNKSPTHDFLKAKAGAMKGLQEKKDALEKELSDEARQELSSLFKSIEDRRGQINQLEDEYREKKEQVAKDLIEQTNKWTQDAYESASYKSQQLIADIERDTQAQIQEINRKCESEKEQIQDNFLAFSAEISTKKAALQKEIEDFEAQQQTIIERFKKDEEARQQADFYHISIDAAAQRDVAQLKTLALNFSKPEILYKLLYEVYYKTKMEELFKRVLGNDRDKGGIYKITNIKNQKVYIGKTTKFIDRWRTHAKRGCGIERIKGQLYDAMFEDGLENYTWEIVEVCDKDKQASMEKYWILFYKSDQWGYNMKVG